MIDVTPAEMDADIKRATASVSAEVESDDPDILIVHGAFSAGLEDVSVPVIVYLHGAARAVGHFYEKNKQVRSPTENYFTDKSINEYRSKIASYLENAERVISNSKFVKAQAKRFYDVDTDVIYPPINTTTFQPLDDEPSDSYFLSVQRMAWYKRLDIQIEAFKELDQNLVIVGDGELESLVSRETEKHDNISYLGRVTDQRLVELYSGAQATIQTSVKEDFGYVPRESLSCGTPVITTYSGGFKELHDRDVDVGRPVPVNDPNALQDAVRSFTPENYDDETLRQVVRENHSVKTVKYEFESIMEEVKHG